MSQSVPGFDLGVTQATSLSSDLIDLTAKGVSGLGKGRFSDRRREVLLTKIQGLLTDFEIAPEAGRTSHAGGLIVALRNSKAAPNTWTWDDASTIEKLLVEVESEDRIRWRLRSTRDEFVEMAGNAAAGTVAAAKALDPASVPIAVAKAELLHCTARFEIFRWRSHFRIRSRTESRWS